jgi:hypothetical protein
VRPIAGRKAPQVNVVAGIRSHGMARSWKARTPRPIWFTDAHEAEAKEAQLRKPPNRFGTWVLRHLGYKGEIGKRTPQAQTRRSHEHPVHRPPKS